MIIFKKHNRFHFFNFFYYYPTFTSNERDKGIKKKYVFLFVFRAVFRIYENVEMCF